MRPVDGASRNGAKPEPDLAQNIAALPRIVYRSPGRTPAEGFFMSNSSYPKARAARAQRYARVRSVGELVPALARPAFEKYGFPAAAILTGWEAIAGAEFARYTAPERLKWPKKAPEDGGSARGATLVLRVAGARALEVEHGRGALIERINAAFGYRAVEEIRLIQAPLQDRAKPRRAQAGTPAAPSSPIGAIAEPRLQAAFQRMASGIAARCGVS